MDADTFLPDRLNILYSCFDAVMLARDYIYNLKAWFKEIL